MTFGKTTDNFKSRIFFLFFGWLGGGYKIFTTATFMGFKLVHLFLYFDASEYVIFVQIN